MIYRSARVLANELLEEREDVGVSNESGDGCDVSPLPAVVAFGVEQQVEHLQHSDGFVWGVADEIEQMLGGRELITFEEGEQLIEKLTIAWLLHYYYYRALQHCIYRGMDFHASFL